MKILFHVSRYWPGIAGAALHTRKMIQHLENRHNQISVIRHFSAEEMTNEIAFANSNYDKINDNQTTIYQLGAKAQWRGIIKFLSNYHQNIRLTRPVFSYGVKQTLNPQFLEIARSHQVIHSVYTGLTPCVVTAQNVAKQLNIPFILTPLPHIQDFHKPLAKSLLRLYQRCDALIAMTEFEKEWLIYQGMNPQLIHVCPIGALVAKTELFDFRQKYQLDDKPMILFIGRQVGYKGYQQLCQATEKVWKYAPETHFVFIGPPTEESQQFFSQYDDRRLLNLGKVSLKEKTSALKTCDILCVPSTEESLGAIYLEAWAYHKPVIGADIPAIRTVISHQQDGLIVPQKPETIAEAILQLLENPILAEQMGKKGNEKVQDEYNWEKLANRLSNIYEKAIMAMA